jgi:hypothetical protein
VSFDFVLDKIDDRAPRMSAVAVKLTAFQPQLNAGGQHRQPAQPRNHGQDPSHVLSMLRPSSGIKGQFLMASMTGSRSRRRKKSYCRLRVADIRE